MSDGALTSTRAAFRLARALNRLGGAIHPPRAREWVADVAFLQSSVGGESGLGEAWSHLTSAPRLTCRAAVLRVLPRHPASGATPPEPLALSPAVVASRRFLQPGFGDWVRGLTATATTRSSIAAGVYRVGNCFAGDPLHVTFVREADGSLRGLEMMGAESLAVAVSAEYFERYDRLDARSRSITVLLEDELLALQSLAEGASLDFPGYGDDEEGEILAEIAFISGAPL